MRLQSLVPQLQRDQLRRELARYESLAGTRSERPVRQAERILTSGWVRGSCLPLNLGENPPWDGHGRPRSWAFHLNAFDPVDPLLRAYHLTLDHRFLEPSLRFALQWIEVHPKVDAGSDFGWYDMAVGVRAYRLGYILDATLRVPGLPHSDLHLLVRSLLDHADALASDERFAGHSNHGLYQAAGQLAICSRFPTLPFAAAGAIQARSRVARYISGHFTEEGVHREHSPGYHWLVLQTLHDLSASGLLDESAERRLDVIEGALAWFVQPDGHLVNLGDTDRVTLAGRATDAIRNPALRYVATQGRQGRSPGENVRAFKESGYWVVRSPWPDDARRPAESSYLVLNAAFHSRTHKHADDLSIVWLDKGRELLVDAGRYGYEGRTTPRSSLWKQGFWYSDPRRIYVESTRAHNTVEIDGRSSPRRVRPYGSAIEAWTTGPEKTYAARARVVHETIEHCRRLVFRPGAWLLLIDELRDRAGHHHSFTQWFTVDPSLDAVADDAHGYVRAAPSEGADDLFLVSLVPLSSTTVARGRTEPDLAGWISREPRVVEPCSSVGFHRSGTSCAFVTLLWIGSERPVTNLVDDGDWRAGISIDEELLRIDETTSSIALELLGSSHHR